MRVKCFSTLSSLITKGVRVCANPTPPMSRDKRVWFKWMATLTEMLACVVGRWARPSDDVFAASHQLNVCGVTASPVSTDVIAFDGPTLAAKSEWGHKPCVHESMRERPFQTVPCNAVPLGRQRSSPDPTTSLAVDLDFREQGNNLFQRNMTDGEILFFSHARGLLSRLGVWREPAPRRHAVPARLLYNRHGWLWAASQTGFAWPA